MKIGKDYIGVSTPFYCTDGRGRILLHRRSKKCRDEQGRWDTGSGQLELGHTLQENVLKEVREEYGCKGAIIEQLPAVSLIRQHEGKPTYWVAVPFIIRVNPAEVRNNEPEKIDELRWFDFKKLPTPLHTGLTQTLAELGEQIGKHFR